MRRSQTAPTPDDVASPTDPVLRFLQTVWQLEHALERASKRMEDAVGISGPQRFALRVIGDRPDITPREVAAALHLHPSTITGIIQRLEARGMVRRTSNAQDARSAHLRLTAAGNRVNKPRIRGTVEFAARETLKRCPPRKQRATGEVLAQFTRELMKI
jgi:DNA-binding MarR family transcriptional regulator